MSNMKCENQFMSKRYGSRYGRSLERYLSTGFMAHGINEISLRIWTLGEHVGNVRNTGRRCTVVIMYVFFIPCISWKQIRVFTQVYLLLQVLATFGLIALWHLITFTFGTGSFCICIIVAVLASLLELIAIFLCNANISNFSNLETFQIHFDLQTFQAGFGHSDKNLFDSDHP